MPGLVTIATSTADDYVDVATGQTLLDRVLFLLREVFEGPGTDVDTGDSAAPRVVLRVHIEDDVGV